MPARHRLTTKKLTGALPPASYADGGGVFLKVTGAGRQTWFFRYQVRGRRRDMPLGNHTPSKDQRIIGEELRAVRDKADQARALAAQGIDPIEHGRLTLELAAGVPGAALEQAQSNGLGEVARAYIDRQAKSWRGRETEKSWRRSFERYALALCDKAVDQITDKDVLSVVEPIWTTMPETAAKLRERIERVLDFARKEGLRTGPNPATWAGNLQFDLGRRQKLSRGHHRKLNHKDAPAFMAALRSRSGMAAHALEWTILTAARESMTLGARWGEVDGDIWTVPKSRMKDLREHRVPLPARCIEILAAVRVGEPKASDLIFPSMVGGELSNAAMDALLRRMKVDAVPHGFRSTFRDWCGDETDYPREIAEEALAHAVGSEVERAYRRGDALEKRRKLMDDWAAFCAKGDQ